ncbi:MAG: tRNA (adenosine(37)-N6)-threonylcarbamoyltransferase complex ATPase subunit type 1 TsaE [Pyrinomonadaceae bacterium]
MMSEVICNTPEETYNIGEQIGGELQGGEVVLLYGGLGVGKTLLTKGILDALDYDIDEVTSPSFTLVNLYKTAKFDVYHIDLWRLDSNTDAAEAVGLSEILEKENIVTIIEWADRLGEISLAGNVLRVFIEGDGDEPRHVTIRPETHEKI